MKKILGFLVLLFPVLLMSCSYIEYVTPKSVIKNRERQYLKATSVRPMRVPPGVANSAFSNEYPIPDKAYPATAADVSLLPPGL